MTDPNPRATIGDNLPPPTVDDDLAARNAALVANANRWLTERPAITDDDLAGRCSDFLEQINAQIKAVDTARAAAKKPYDDGAKAVQLLYRPLLDVLDAAKNLLKTRLQAWLNKKAKALVEERAKAAAEAAARQKEADEAAAKAAAGTNVEAQVEAQRLAAEAEKAKAEAAYLDQARPQAKGDFGARAASLRVTLKGRILDIDLCFQHYREHRDVVDALYKAVNADIRRGARSIPGVEIYPEQSVA